MFFNIERKRESTELLSSENKSKLAEKFAENRKCIELKCSECFWRMLLTNVFQQLFFFNSFFWDENWLGFNFKDARIFCPWLKFLSLCLIAICIYICVYLCTEFHKTITSILSRERKAWLANIIQVRNFIQVCFDDIICECINGWHQQKSLISLAYIWNRRYCFSLNSYSEELPIATVIYIMSTGFFVIPFVCKMNLWREKRAWRKIKWKEIS